MQRIKTQGNMLIKNGIIDIDRIDNKYIQFSEYDIISKKRIVVDNPEDFHKDTLIVFGNIKKGNKIIFDKSTLNTITNISDNVLTLKNNVNCKNCKYIFMKSFRTFYNNNRFQFKNSECGVYSMHFIEEFLNGKDFEEIVSDIIHDDKINKKRKIFL